MNDGTNLRARLLLERWIHGFLEPQVESQGEHAEVFASAIKPIAEGMLNFVRADTEGRYSQFAPAHDDPNTEPPFPRVHKLDRSEGRIVVFNMPAPSCHCDMPSSTYTFGATGKLGLIAAVLEAGHALDGHPIAQINLVLPHGSFNWPERNSNVGFAVASFDTRDTSSGRLYRPFDQNYYLRRALGLSDETSAYLGMAVMGGLDVGLGFPGGVDYLAKHLPDLGSYLTALGNRLFKGHPHK